jgi:hypothetical protein
MKPDIQFSPSISYENILAGVVIPVSFVILGIFSASENLLDLSSEKYFYYWIIGLFPLVLSLVVFSIRNSISIQITPTIFTYKSVFGIKVIPIKNIKRVCLFDFGTEEISYSRYSQSIRTLYLDIDFLGNSNKEKLRIKNSFQLKQLQEIEVCLNERMKDITQSRSAS